MKDSCVYRTKGFADSRMKWLCKESNAIMKSQHTLFIPISQALLSSTVALFYRELDLKESNLHRCVPGITFSLLQKKLLLSLQQWIYSPQHGDV
jgi:hypothetical protein